MPTPIGHSLAGAVVYAFSTKGKDLLRSWRWLVVCMAFAALADIDFLPALLGKIELANRVHRGPTHSLLLAVLVSGVAFGVLRILGRPQAGKWTGVLLLCLLSHVLLDLLGKDHRAPVGVPLAWPLSKRYFKAPVEVFPDLHKDSYAEMFSLHNMGVVAYETLVFGTIFIVIGTLKLRHATRNGAKKEQGSAGLCPGKQFAGMLGGMVDTAPDEPGCEFGSSLEETEEQKWE